MGRLYELHSFCSVLGLTAVAGASSLMENCVKGDKVRLGAEYHFLKEGMLQFFYIVLKTCQLRTKEIYVCIMGSGDPLKLNHFHCIMIWL